MFSLLIGLWVIIPIHGLCLPKMNSEVPLSRGRMQSFDWLDLGLHPLIIIGHQKWGDIYVGEFCAHVQGVQEADSMEAM